MTQRWQQNLPQTRQKNVTNPFLKLGYFLKNFLTGTLMYNIFNVVGNVPSFNVVLFFPSQDIKQNVLLSSY